MFRMFSPLFTASYPCSSFTMFEKVQDQGAYLQSTVLEALCDITQGWFLCGLHMWRHQRLICINRMFNRLCVFSQSGTLKTSENSNLVDLLPYKTGRSEAFLWPKLKAIITRCASQIVPASVIFSSSCKRNY